MFICFSLAYCASTQGKIVNKKESEFQSQYEKAVVAMRYGFVDMAIDYLNQALSLNPSHGESYYLLGVAYFKKRNFTEAGLAFEKCVGLKPDFSEAHSFLGSSYQEMGLGNKAEEEFKKAYALDNNFNASFNLAKIYFDKNEMDLALDYVQKSIQKNINSAPAYNLQGAILNKMSRYSDAILSFQNALRIDPKYAIAGVNLGITYINNKEYDKAREIFNNILPLVQEQSLRDKINEYLEMIKDKDRFILPSGVVFLEE